MTSPAPRGPCEPRLPGRYVGIDDEAQQAAIGEAVAAAAARQPGRGRPVAIVAYAGSGRHRAGADAASDRTRILAALDRLEAGGSTAGAEGIRQAYALAERDFDPKGVNRVILATDGDFNVGHHRSGPAEGLYRGGADEGRLSVRARLWHGQLQRCADADAGAERQWRRRLHRHAERGTQRRW